MYLYLVIFKENNAENADSTVGTLEVNWFLSSFNSNRKLQFVVNHKKISLHVLFLSSLILLYLECSGVCIFQKKTVSSFFFFTVYEGVKLHYLISNFSFVVCVLACL